MLAGFLHRSEQSGKVWKLFACVYWRKNIHWMRDLQLYFNLILEFVKLFGKHDLLLPSMVCLPRYFNHVNQTFKSRWKINKIMDWYETLRYVWTQTLWLLIMTERWGRAALIALLLLLHSSFMLAEKKPKREQYSNICFLVCFFSPSLFVLREYIGWLAFFVLHRHMCVMQGYSVQILFFNK